MFIFIFYSVLRNKILIRFAWYIHICKLVRIGSYDNSSTPILNNWWSLTEYLKASRVAGMRQPKTGKSFLPFECLIRRDYIILYHIFSSSGVLKTYFSFSDAHFSEYSVACCVVQFLCQVQFRLSAENTFLPFAKQILNLSQNFFVPSRVTCQYAFIRCFHGMLIYFLRHFTRNRSVGSGSLVVRNEIAWGDKVLFIYRTNSDGFRWQTMTWCAQSLLQSTKAPLKVLFSYVTRV